MTDQEKELETAACTPLPVNTVGINRNAKLPYGLTTRHIHRAMNEFVSFLGFINTQLATKGIPRFESMLMPANFSSMVGEFMGTTIPKCCKTLVKNQYHNGHPDLIPAGRFPNDAVQYAPDGVEIKASRYARGWQGHNPEDVWLMVFILDSNRPKDGLVGVAPKPFQFLAVLAAKLTKKDWLFAGRSETSRRTITASVTPAGYAKMMANWIYRAPELR